MHTLHNIPPGSRAKHAHREHEVAAQAALDSSQIMQPQQVRAISLRRERWRRRQVSGKFLRPLAQANETPYLKQVRPARCAWTLGQSVGIMHDGSRPAGYTGIERCSSIWACPHCSAVIRAGRATEIQQAVEAHQEQGGELLFFTGTLRHHQGDDLATTLDAVLEAWRKMTGNRPWKERKQRHSITGYIRSIEVTHGANGWHPHAHVLLFLDEKMSADELADFRSWIFNQWSNSVEKAGGKRPNEQGLDLQPVDKKGKVIARYISKIQDEKKWTAGAEMARADVKNGRGNSITPLQLLDEETEMDERTRATLWREFYSATKGRRAITWSRGLKARYEIGEQTDEDILDDAESTTIVWRTSAANYRAANKRGAVTLAIALELAEAEAWTDLEKILPTDWSPDERKKRSVTRPPERKKL
nr:unnamed protein product [uncultured bacterium]